MVLSASFSAKPKKHLKKPFVSERLFSYSDASHTGQQMPHLEQSSKLDLLRYVAKWVALATLVAALAGSASALFLFSLDWATQTREANRWLIWGLPVAGFCVGWLYLKFGQHVEAGNNLLIDEIHDPQKIVPLRMAPFVLGGTVMSHLFGASVGREGTAVQMGGALADQLTHFFKLNAVDRRMVLMAGISAGFALVFGTPLVGAVFALEVLAIGRMRLDALLPCVIAAVVADQVGLLWGVQHTQYDVGLVPRPNRRGESGDHDQQVLALLFRDRKEWAVGHNTSPQAAVPDADGVVRAIGTTQLPCHEVKRVVWGDADLVAVHFHFHRQKGTRGHAIVDLLRVADGYIVEHWDVMQDVVEGGPNPASPF